MQMETLGTGKSSLSAAFASFADVELCPIKFSGIIDALLDRVFINLPSRCAVLPEDLDAGGGPEKI